MPDSRLRRSAPLLLAGATVAAAGYGATFLLSSFYRARGGGDLDTARTLGAAMAGAFTGVPIVGWFSGRFDAARMVAVGCGLLGLGYVLLVATSGVAGLPSLAPGFLIGFGWGVFYLGAPMSLSERVGDADRGYWFTRFGAFQMAGIGGGPLCLDLLVHRLRVPPGLTFVLVGVACGLAGAAFWGFAAMAPVARSSRAIRPWLRPGRAVARGRSAYPIAMVAFGACIFAGLLTYQSSLVAGTDARPATFYAVYAATVVVARLAFGRRLATMPQRPLATGLLVAMTCGVAAMFGVSLSPVFQVAAALLTGIGYGLVYTVIQTWAVNDAAEDDRHAALTWFVIFYFVGTFGFPMVGGPILVHLGRLPFLVVLLAASLAELVVAFLRPRDPSPATGEAGRT